MDDQPNETAAPAARSQPKFFSSVNGVIAGATGLVIALGGLATAYDRMFDKDKPETAVAADQGAAAPVAAANIPSEPEADAPLRYEGDDASIEWIDDKWVIVTSEGRWEYEDMYSKYEGYVLAFDKENDAYLRWPINGGLAEEGESDDGELRWKEWIKFYPPARDDAG